MRRLRVLLTFRMLLMAFGLVTLPLMVSIPAAAQFGSYDITDDEIADVTDEFCDPSVDDCTVESVASILDTTNSGELDYYSGTYISFDLIGNGYYAEDDWYLGQCSSGCNDINNYGIVDSGIEYDDGTGTAEIYNFYTLSLGSGYAYAVESDSYIDDDLGDSYFILPSLVAVSTGLPQLQSVSPVYAFVGTSGTITITGQSLIDPFDGSVTPSFCSTTQGGGCAASLGVASESPDGTQVVLAYTLAQTSTTGRWNITLQTRFGIGTMANSNTPVFTVGDPTPVITGVTPGSWTAGTTIPITISGTGFGTTPTLTIAGPGVSYSTGPVSDTSIQATVTIDPTSPGGPATIQVQSNGYIGNGFVPAYPGQSNTATGSAVIVPFPAPPPAIVYGTDSSACSGTNLVNTVQNRIVGQQVALVGCVSLPGGLYITSQSWYTQGAVVGGYNASAASGTSFRVPNYTAQAIVFYWYYGPSGTQNQVQYTYCMSNGQCSSTAQATVTFSIATPTNLNVIVCPSSINQSCPMNNMQMTIDANVPRLEAGNYSNNQFSIQFSEYPPLTPPAGSGTGAQVLWVQLLSSDSYQLLTTNQQYCQGGPVCNAIPNGWNGSPQLDNWYPYAVDPATPWGTNDTPSYLVGSAASESEVERSFGATMYLLWDPGLPSGCTPANTHKVNGQYVQTASNCTQSIPIPLGTVTWNTSGCAVNTLSTGTGENGTTWHLLCGIPSSNAPESPTFTSATGSLSSYPTWSLTEINGNVCTTHTCTKQ